MDEEPVPSEVAVPSEDEVSSDTESFYCVEAHDELEETVDEENKWQVVDEKVPRKHTRFITKCRKIGGRRYPHHYKAARQLIQIWKQYSSTRASSSSRPTLEEVALPLLAEMR